MEDPPTTKTLTLSNVVPFLSEQSRIWMFAARWRVVLNNCDGRVKIAPKNWFLLECLWLYCVWSSVSARFLRTGKLTMKRKLGSLW